MPLDSLLMARLQFAMTAGYHFIFVPLTLGLIVLIGIMETIYVITQKQIWRDMVKFWGALFGINFAMGAATGIALEFQFGTNWSYYSHYVGDVFGALLALEGMMAFFLEATLIGLFFFGWKRLSQKAHLAVTWLLALGTNSSAFWILIANAWMQNPVGSKFNPETMRMEVTDFWTIVFNPVAQAKFVHTVCSGYVIGAVFVMSVSAWYLLRKKHHGLARRSMAVAAPFGLLCAIGLIIMGDESGYTASQNQKMKLAALEAIWETEEAPAPLLLFALPDAVNQKNYYEVKIPYALGIIATRSLTKPVYGMKDLIEQNKQKIRVGQKALGLLEQLRLSPKDSKLRDEFDKISNHLGYGMLLKRYTQDPVNADSALVDKAARDTIPAVSRLFWSFRFMVGIGFYLLLFFGLACWYTTKHDFEHPLLLRLSVLTLPLPWIAAMLGWIIAENGRQPWAVEGILPTFLAASPQPYEKVLWSFIGFVGGYTILAIIDLYVMLRTIRKGPEYSTHN